MVLLMSNHFKSGSLTYSIFNMAAFVCVHAIYSRVTLKHIWGNVNFQTLDNKKLHVFELEKGHSPIVYLINWRTVIFFQLIVSLHVLDVP